MKTEDKKLQVHKGYMTGISIPLEFSKALSTKMNNIGKKFP